MQEPPNAGFAGTVGHSGTTCRGSLGTPDRRIGVSVEHAMGRSASQISDLSKGGAELTSC